MNTACPWIIVALMLACSFLTGCNKPAAPPAPIAMDEAPKSLEEAFRAASPQAKQLADEVSAALGAKDYAKALLALQALSARSDLAPAQRELATRTLLAVNKALDEQAAAGNQEAEKVLEFRRATK